MAESMKGYVKLRETTSDQNSSFRRVYSIAHEQGFFRDKVSMNLAGNCFMTLEGYNYYLNSLKKIMPNAKEEISILEKLGKHMVLENLPLALAISTDRRIDKILEENGFTSLDSRV